MLYLICTPSASLHFVSFRSSPSKRDSAVGFTEPLGRRSKGKAMYTLDIVAKHCPPGRGTSTKCGGGANLSVHLWLNKITEFDVRNSKTQIILVCLVALN